MRKIAWTLAAAMALPFPALAQQGPTRSVDDYVCTFSDDCPEEAEAAPTAEETVTDKGRARVSSTRGFSLARPKAKETNSAAPKAAANRPAGTPRTQSAATERPRSRAAAPAKPAGAQRRRADLRVTFELGSATLTNQAREEARVFAQALKTPQLSNKRFVIEGHTDSIGGRHYNLDLSRRRAQAVVEYLTSLGVDASRLDVRGYGFDRPLDGRSAAAMENRRVEAVLATG
jgi:outer membrane protein OmpA-like peptidoglycan-associated protein